MKDPQIGHLSLKKNDIDETIQEVGWTRRDNFSSSFLPSLLTHPNPLYYVLINFEI